MNGEYWAIECGERKISYEEMRRDVDCWSSALLLEGIGSGDMVGLLRREISPP